MVSEKKLSLLIVDDNPDNLLLLESMLEEFDVNIISAQSGREALELAEKQEFALILLDVMMPDMDGYETAINLKQIAKTRHVPIIFLTALAQSKKEEEKGYQVGAVDFLLKPIEPFILESKINIFLKMARRQEELEQTTTFIQKQNIKLEQKAIRDSLTGLYNNEYLKEQLADEVVRLSRYHAHLSFLLLDLDHFKRINDNCGHPFGDYVLHEFARRNAKMIRHSDVFARYGGEEFGLIMPHTDAEAAVAVAEKIREETRSTEFKSGKHHSNLTVSIGICSFFGKEIVSPGELIEFADRALYQAKRGGRDRVILYDPSRHAKRLPQAL